jgi:hypothetical protein
MFETRRTTSNVFFLVSNVILGLSGSFFEKWGNAFQKWGAAPVVSDGKVISVMPGIEDFYKWKSFSVMREK